MLGYLGTGLSTEAATFDHIARWEMGYPRKEKGNQGKSREINGYCYVLNEELEIDKELISNNTF